VVRTTLLVNNNKEKWAWPCHALSGDRTGSTKIFKIFWNSAYTMEKELRQNIKPFSRNHFVTKKGRGPATPFWAVRYG
jgi:hypothetical protein